MKTQPSLSLDFAASFSLSGKPAKSFSLVICSSKALVSANTFSPNFKERVESFASISLSLLLSSSFKLAPFLAKLLYCLSRSIVCSGDKSKVSFTLKTAFTLANKAVFKVMSFPNSLNKGETSCAIF